MRRTGAPETDRFRLLDIVRGAVILGVIWQHTYFEHFAGLRAALVVGEQHVYPIVFNNGFLGVNPFLRRQRIRPFSSEIDG